MNVPKAPNVEFSFALKAPKANVMDAWHLLKPEGGAIEPITSRNPKGNNWPGVADDMERIINVGVRDVPQVVGNVQTSEKGNWYFELMDQGKTKQL